MTNETQKAKVETLKIQGALDVYRVRVKGYHATVYQGRKRLGAWHVSVPNYLILLGQATPAYIATCAVGEAEKR